MTKTGTWDLREKREREGEGKDNGNRRASIWIHMLIKPQLTLHCHCTYSLQSISVQLILTLTRQSGDHSHFVGEETGPREVRDFTKTTSLVSREEWGSNSGRKVSTAERCAREGVSSPILTGNGHNRVTTNLTLQSF